MGEGGQAGEWHTEPAASSARCRRPPWGQASRHCGGPGRQPDSRERDRECAAGRAGATMDAGCAARADAGGAVHALACRDKAVVRSRSSSLHHPGSHVWPAACVDCHFPCNCEVWRDLGLNHGGDSTRHCETMHDIPEHLAAEIVFRIMNKGKPSLPSPCLRPHFARPSCNTSCALSTPALRAQLQQRGLTLPFIPGHLTPQIARKMLTSNSTEMIEFAGACLENLNCAEIAAGPLTAKGTGHGGCRP